MTIQVETMAGNQVITQSIGELRPRPLFAALVVDDQYHKREDFLTQWKQEMNGYFRCGNKTLKGIEIVACDSTLPLLTIGLNASAQEKEALIDFLDRFDIVYMDEQLHTEWRGNTILNMWHHIAPLSWTQRVLYTAVIKKDVIEGISYAHGGKERIRLFDRSAPINALIEKVGEGRAGINEAAEIAFRSYVRKRRDRIPEIQDLLDTDWKDGMVADRLQREGLTINGVHYAAGEIFPEIRRSNGRANLSSAAPPAAKVEALEEVIRKLRLQRKRPNLSLTFSAALNGHGMAQLTHPKRSARPDMAPGFIETPDELRRIVNGELTELGKVVNQMSSRTEEPIKATAQICLRDLTVLKQTIENLEDTAWNVGAANRDLSQVSTVRRLFQRNWRHVRDNIARIDERLQDADRYKTSFEVFFPFVELLGDELSDLARTLARKGEAVTGQLWWAAWEQRNVLHEHMISEVWQDVELFCLLQEKPMPPSVLDTDANIPAELVSCLINRLPVTRLFGEVYVVLFDQQAVFDVQLMEWGHKAESFKAEDPAFLSFDLDYVRRRIEDTDARHAQTALVCAFRTQKVCDNVKFEYDDAIQRYVRKQH